MKKVIAVFVVHAKDIFSTLGKFHCNRHNYYYGHRELKIEKINIQARRIIIDTIN
jgi:hypothetical protein